MLKKTLEKLKSLLGISLILLILFFWKISIAQTDTTTTVDTTIVQIQQIQTDLDEIKEMFKEQKRILEEKLEEKNKPKTTKNDK